MSNAALIAIVVGALLTVLTAAALGTIVNQRISRALREAATAARRLAAASAEIGEEQQITRRELDRLESSLERLRDHREQR
ncbi:MAG: hypothetical protein EA340_04695 [Nitriliruptor sp.]|nr:MAG: hypothetical protein EA340_04695 [Nitriliruptor sp.]